MERTLRGNLRRGSTRLSARPGLPGIPDPEQSLIACASAGDFARINPHLHGIVLEGGFDRGGRFVHVPSLDVDTLSQYFRSTMIAFFLKRALINERLARNMLGWIHSGFNVDLSVKIPAASSKASEAITQYIARGPVSLKKILVEEPLAGSRAQPCERRAGSVLCQSGYNPTFRSNPRAGHCTACRTPGPG